MTFGPRQEVIVYTEYFWQLNVQDQSEVIECISDVRQPCTSKTNGDRAKRTNTWAGCGGGIFIVYRVLFTVKRLRSFLRSFGTFRFSANLYLEKSERDYNLELGSKYSVYTGYFWQLGKCVSVHFWFLALCKIWLCQQSSWNWNLSIVLRPSVRVAIIFVPNAQISFKF